MKEASTTGVVADAVHARKLMEQAQRLRAEKQAEKDAKAKRGQLSHKDKEKRKRNAGMQASCARLLLCVVRLATMLHNAQRAAQMRVVDCVAVCTGTCKHGLCPFSSRWYRVQMCIICTLEHALAFASLCVGRCHCAVPRLHVHCKLLFENQLVCATPTKRRGDVQRRTMWRRRSGEHEKQVSTTGSTREGYSVEAQQRFSHWGCAACCPRGQVFGQRLRA